MFWSRMHWVAFGITLGLATLSSAADRTAPETLLAGLKPLRATSADVANAAVRLAFDPADYQRTVAAAATGAEVILPAFPLAPDVTVDLALRGFRVTDGRSQFVRDGLEPLAPPDVLLLRGHVVGEPAARAYLALSPTGSNGYVVRSGRTFVLATVAEDPSRPNVRITLVGEWSAAAEDSAIPPWSCESDRLTPLNQPLEGFAGGSIALTTDCLEAIVALETDTEYYGLFGDAAAANAYLVQLVGAISDMYERDLGVQLVIGFSRLWTTGTDPWVSPNGLDELFEFQDYWNLNMTGVSRVTAHKISGRNVDSPGGVAYVGGLCYPEFDYALSRYINGSFPSPLKSGSNSNWDPHVVAHEWGHIFGSPHTHDYAPPIDVCASDCSQPYIGTMMSYCHICGGNAAIQMMFHNRVQQVIRDTIALYGCLTATTSCSYFPRGDLNCDGVIDSFDIAGFILALTSQSSYNAAYPDCDGLVLADMDADGDVDAFDIQPFIQSLTGP